MASVADGALARPLAAPAGTASRALLLVCASALAACSTADPAGARGPRAGDSGLAEDGGGRTPSVRVTAYYPAWRDAILGPHAIDFGVVTDVIHASVRPRPDGSLDADRDKVTPARSAALVHAAHAAGRHALVSIGGQASQAAFESAMDDAHRSAFVRSITALVSARGYDGVDLDMEPIEARDDASYGKLVTALRASLGAGAELTAVTRTEPALFASLQGSLSAIHLLTYNLSGTFAGWDTWFDSPLNTAGNVFMGSGRPMPSCSSIVHTFVEEGVSPAKLELGVHSYGLVWNGASGPNQPIDGVTTQPVSYADILDHYEPMGSYHWKDGVEAPYLVVQPATAFITYDDPRLVREKVAYARSTHLGGVFIWELTGAHRSSQPAGQQDPLLTAIGQAVR